MLMRFVLREYRVGDHGCYLQISPPEKKRRPLASFSSLPAMHFATCAFNCLNDMLCFARQCDRVVKVRLEIHWALLAVVQIHSLTLVSGTFGLSLADSARLLGLGRKSAAAGAAARSVGGRADAA